MPSLQPLTARASTAVTILAWAKIIAFDGAVFSGKTVGELLYWVEVLLSRNRGFAIDWWTDRAHDREQSDLSAGAMVWPEEHRVPAVHWYLHDLRA